jgi:hypothetical protein
MGEHAEAVKSQNYYGGVAEPAENQGRCQLNMLRSAVSFPEPDEF